MVTKTTKPTDMDDGQHGFDTKRHKKPAQNTGLRAFLINTSLGILIFFSILNFLFGVFMLALDLYVLALHDWSADAFDRQECIETGSLNGDSQPCIDFGMTIGEEPPPEK